MPHENQNFLEQIIIAIVTIVVIYFIITAPVGSFFGYIWVMAIGVLLVSGVNLYQMGCIDKKVHKFEYIYLIVWTLLFAFAAYLATSGAIETSRYGTFGILFLSIVGMIYSGYSYWQEDKTTKTNGPMIKLGVSLLGQLMITLTAAHELYASA